MAESIEAAPYRGRPAMISVSALAARTAVLAMASVVDADMFGLTATNFTTPPRRARAG